MRVAFSHFFFFFHIPVRTYDRNVMKFNTYVFSVTNIHDNSNLADNTRLVLVPKIFPKQYMNNFLASAAKIYFLNIFFREFRPKVKRDTILVLLHYLPVRLYL